MNWLLDAHIPPSLAEPLTRAGESVLHTRDLPRANSTPDSEVCRVSVAEKRIVVTKDSDFYHSYLLKGEPWKLLLVRTGNMNLSAFQALFIKYLPLLLEEFKEGNLIELHAGGLRILQ